MTNLERIVLEKGKELIIYSRYGFLRDIDPDRIALETVIKPMFESLEAGNMKAEEIMINDHIHYFIFKNLEWDTRYFGFPVYRIEYILFDHSDLNIINSAIKTFSNKYISRDCYWFMNVPADDLLLVQSLCSTPFRLVETRIDFHLENVQNYRADHYSVRRAGIDDIEELKQIAIRMRNKFDRVHADPAFSAEQADAYLGTFAEESVRGFADYVLIPDIANQKPFGFLAGNKPADILGYSISKLVLTAIDSSVERGWLFKLLMEMIHLLKNDGAEFILSNTQGSNKASLRIWQKAGFWISSVTHIFSIKK